MDYVALKQEIIAGPLAAQCVGKTSKAIAALFNAPTKPTAKATITGAELRGITDTTELLALPVASAVHFWGLAGLEEISVQAGTPMQKLLDELLKAAPKTKAALDALLLVGGPPISVAQEKGWETVQYWDVARALNLPGVSPDTEKWTVAEAEPVAGKGV